MTSDSPADLSPAKKKILEFLAAGDGRPRRIRTVYGQASNPTDRAIAPLNLQELLAEGLIDGVKFPKDNALGFKISTKGRAALGRPLAPPAPAYAPDPPEIQKKALDDLLIDIESSYRESESENESARTRTLAANAALREIFRRFAALEDTREKALALLRKRPVCVTCGLVATRVSTLHREPVCDDPEHTPEEKEPSTEVPDAAELRALLACVGGLPPRWNLCETCPARAVCPAGRFCSRCFSREAGS